MPGPHPAGSSTAELQGWAPSWDLTLPSPRGAPEGCFGVGFSRSSSCSSSLSCGQVQPQQGMGGRVFHRE